MDENKLEVYDGFDKLAQEGRVEDSRMNIEAISTPEQREDGLREIREYIINEQITKAEFSRRAGVSASTLSEVLNGTYAGDTNKIVRRCLRFLAEEAKRSKKTDFGRFCLIDIVQRAWAVITWTITHGCMAFIGGPSGCGKTYLINAYASVRDNVFVIRIGQTDGSKSGVLAAVCEALKLSKRGPARAMAGRIKRYLECDKSVVFLVDECQNLTMTGLETFRDIHDTSDLSGRRPVPIVFFGDARFYRLLVRARSGERSPISPQLSRRIYPILDLEKHGLSGDGGGMFTEADILQIVANGKVRFVDNRGVKWLTALANTPGYGSLGFAIVVLKLADEIVSDPPIKEEDLRAAIEMVLGPKAVKTANEAAGGALLTAVG